MTRKKEKTNTKRIFHYFWKAMMKARWRTIIILVLMPIYVAIDVIVLPLGTSKIIAQLGTGDFEFAHYTGILLWTIIPTVFRNIVLVRIIDYLDWTIDADGGKYLSELAFDCVTNQSMTFHANHFSGSLTSAANKLSNAFIRLKSNVVWDLYPMILSLGLALVSVFQIAPVFAGILTAFIAAYATIVVIFTKKTRYADEALAKVENERTGQLADSITNMISVKSYANEKFEHRRFERITKRHKQAYLKVAKLSNFRNLTLNSIGTIVYISFLLLIIAAYNLWGLTVANVLFLYSLTNTVLNHVWSLHHILRTFNQSIADSKDIVEILDLPVIVDDKTDHPLKIQNGTIEFSHISFAHDGQASNLFEDFSLKINPGERIGLVGLSGSGKTTLTKLLLRFADVNSGAIYIDGQDIRDVTQATLRKNIAYVPQESTLFHRSISENIAYARPSATQREIKNAAILANADVFIKDLPEGYKTLVGERGTKLSGGQRQRVAIARAILKDAPILVLDEATSALDSESESLIQNSLENLMAGRTSLVIAHRLSTVANLDRIVVLRDGKIVEQGPHSELIKNPNGEYARLWSRQSGAFLGKDCE